MSWQEVVGHRENVERFRRAEQRNRLGSAYLFAGPRGVGKHRFARQLAQTLFCAERPAGHFDACGHCAACQLVVSDTHPDLLTVAKRPEKSVVELELIAGERENRFEEGLLHDLYRKPMIANRRFAILDDADLLNQESGNALLKALEEPPPRAVMVLLGTTRERQLRTIQSRCQVIPFRPLSTAEVVEVLATLPDVESSIPVDELAAASQGSVFQAITLSDPSVFEFRRDWLTRLSCGDPWRDQGVKSVISFSEALGKDGPQRRDRLQLVASWTLAYFQGLIYRLTDQPVSGDRALLDCIARGADGWRAPWRGLEMSLQRTVDFQQHVAANVGAPNAVEAWLIDLARLAAGHPLPVMAS